MASSTTASQWLSVGPIRRDSITVFEQENFSTPRMRTAYHMEVVANGQLFRYCKASSHAIAGLESLHSPNDDSNYTHSQLVVTYTFPSHLQGIVQNLRSQEMTTCRQKLEDMEPTERKKGMFQSFGFGQ